MLIEAAFFCIAIVFFLIITKKDIKIHLIILVSILMLLVSVPFKLHISPSIRRGNAIEGIVTSATGRGFYFISEGITYFFRFNDWQIFTRDISNSISMKDIISLKDAFIDKKPSSGILDEAEKQKFLTRFTRLKLKISSIKGNNTVFGQFEIIKQSKKESIFDLLAAINLGLKLTLEEALGVSEAMLVYSLLTGERSYSDSIISFDLYKIGVGHVFAISGLHLGVIYLFLKKSLSILPMNLANIQVILLLFLLFGFLIFTGFPDSAVRAFVMILVYEISIAFKRNSTLGDVLLLSACIILTFRPQAVLSPGFQLSFASVFAIAFVLPIIECILKEQGIILKKNWMITSFLLTFSIQIMTLPLQIYYFKNIPLLGSLANIFVVPLMPLLLACSVILFISSKLELNGLLALMAFVLKMITRSVFQIAQLFSSMPLSYLNFSTDRSEMIFQASNCLLIFSCLIIIYSFFRRRRHSIQLVFILLVVVLSCFLAVNRFGERAYFFNVGHGGSIGVKKQDCFILIDLGPPNFSVYEKIKAFACPYPSAIFVSHYHLDHIGGFFKILSGFRLNKRKPIIYLPEPRGTKEVQTCRVLIRFLKNSGYRYLFLPEKIQFRNGLKIINHSLRKEAQVVDSNERSAVLEIQIGRNKRILYPGDAPAEAFSFLPAKKFNVIVASHHGSLTGFDDQFFKDFRGLVVIQSGKNSYGLPNELVIDYFKNQNIKFKRTDKDGTVVVAF
ncbi:MAG: ComEC/Rec2 family competence protein [Actinobacteria bacterium]|nr:ComEC/Rec2 family competence protein [Actinomycetota bacterium]